MQIEDVKAWQWSIVGILVGLAFSAVLVGAGPWFDTESLDTLTQGEFEQRLLGQSPRNEAGLVAAYHKDQPMVRDVVVHPPVRGDASGSWWVSGKACDLKFGLKDPKDPKSKQVVVEEWTPFKYPAPAPYVPGYASAYAKARAEAAQAAREKKQTSFQTAIAIRRAAPIDAERAAFGNVDQFENVTAYLKAAKAVADKQAADRKAPAKGATFAYAVAWWDKPAAQWTLPPVAGLLVIGIAWPLGLTALQSVGMARPPKAVKKPKPAPVATPVKRDHSAGVPVVAPTAPVPPPVNPGESKEYGGEFYPVVKQTHK